MSSAVEMWTIGTYNLLHPTYAVKYLEKTGLDANCRSNWPLRAEVIANLLVDAGLDIYLLQEVGREQLSDLLRLLGDRYEETFAVHPGREARDGTAVLTRRARLQVMQSCAVPLPSATGRPYMSAAAVCALDRASGLRLGVVSGHLYEARGKSHDPEGRIHDFLDGCLAGESQTWRYDIAVWGGDCNKGYMPCGQGPRGFRHVPGGPKTCKSRQIDWIFFSPQCTGMRGAPATEKFIASTQHVIAGSGCPPSDHFGESISFAYSDVRHSLPQVAPRG